MAQTAPDILDSKLTMFRQDGNIKHLLDAMDKYSKQQNAEYIEALREAKQIILELEGARFMKTSFYDQINSLLK